MMTLKSGAVEIIETTDSTEILLIDHLKTLSADSITVRDAKSCKPLRDLLHRHFALLVDRDILSSGVLDRVTLAIAHVHNRVICRRRHCLPIGIREREFAGAAADYEALRFGIMARCCFTRRQHSGGACKSISVHFKDEMPSLGELASYRFETVLSDERCGFTLLPVRN